MKRSGRLRAAASLWILPVNPPERTPQRLILAPFAARRPLVRTHDRAAEHEILVVALGGQCCDHPFPHAGMAPSAEASVNGLPLAVVLGQVLPTFARWRMIRLPQGPRSADRRGGRPSAAPTGNYSRTDGCPSRSDPDPRPCPAAWGRSRPTAPRSAHRARSEWDAQISIEPSVAIDPTTSRVATWPTDGMARPGTWNGARNRFPGTRWHGSSLTRHPWSS